MLARGKFARTLGGSGALTGGSSSSPGSEGSNSNTTFKPLLFIIGLVVIAALALGYRWKRQMERRTRLSGDGTSDEGMHLKPEERVPHLWDVHVNCTRGILEGWSWKTTQPLSVVPSLRPTSLLSPSSKNTFGLCTALKGHTITKPSPAQQRQSGDSNTVQSDRLLRVSIIIAMPSRSRGSHLTQATTTTGIAEEVGVSREHSVSDALEGEDFDFVIGVAQIPYMQGEG